ncbi:MAG: hypothetical protein M0R46_18240 [Candidatus Muirbacterium halophilum]|nr:hypothetical protein [Candidatus Muirbacterium halophilum]
MYCFRLYCFRLYCFRLYCFRLYCFRLYCFRLNSWNRPNNITFFCGTRCGFLYTFKPRVPCFIGNFRQQ